MTLWGVFTGFFVETDRNTNGDPKYSTNVDLEPSEMFALHIIHGSVSVHANKSENGAPKEPAKQRKKIR